MRGKSFDGGKRKLPNNLQHKNYMNVMKLIVNIAFSIYIIKLKIDAKNIYLYIYEELYYMPWICVRQVFDKPFNTFKLTNNNIS